MVGLTAVRERILQAGSNQLGFVRSVFVLAVGTAAGQAIIIIGSPILLRLYDPDELGAFGVYLAVVSILAIAVTLRYEAALPLPEAEDEALDLLALVLVTTVALSAVVGLTVWLLAANVIPVDLPPATRAVLWLLPVGLVFAALQQTLTLWATRLSAFGTSARSSVIAAGMQTASQIGLGVPGTGVLGLVVGYLIGRVGGIGVLLGTITSTRWSTLRHTSPRRIRAVAVRFRRFPLYVLWAALLNTLSVQAPVLLLAAMFDTTVVGWFSITVRVLQLPSTIIGNAVAQVFYARVSRESHVGARATTAAVYRSLLALGTGPMVLLAIGGQQLFSFAFGDAWTEAGAYAQWLAPWLLLVFVTSPLSTLVYVRERQGAELVFQIVLLVVRTTSLVVGWVMGSATLAIALFGIASAASWGPYMLWLLRLGGVRVSESLSWLSRNLAIALLLAAPLLFFTILGVQGIAWAVLATVTLVVMLLRARHEIAAGEMPSEPEMPAEAARPEDGDSGTYPE